MPGEATVFIGGCMRSGTTLVQRVLCGGRGVHPLLAECQYLVALLAAYREGRKGFALFGVDYFGDLAGYDAFNRGIVESFLGNLQRRLGVPRHMVLMRPELAFHFSDLATRLPEARFVLVARDPRDAIASMLDVGKRHAARGVSGPLVAMGRDMDRLSAFFLDYYRDSYTNTGALSGRLMTLRYEDLVANSDDALSQLQRFTGIELDRGALGAPDPVAASRSWQSMAADPAYSGAFWSENWMGEVTGDSVGRHREALSTAEISTIEARCAGFARSFRYW